MVEIEYIKVAYLPCNSFNRIMDWIDKNAEILHIGAARGIQNKTVRNSVEGLDFIKLKDLKLKALEIDYSKAGRHGINVFPVSKVKNVLEDTEIEDIAVKHLDLIVDAKEFYEKYIKENTVTKSADSRIILSFSAAITKNEQMRHDISRFTAYQIDKLKFKYETLDLVGIFSLADKAKQENSNLLPSANQDTKMLKEAMKLVFSTAPLRLRSYNSKGRKSWELSGTEEFG